MDEASSRFVDRLAMERLVDQKLAKVHHRPSLPIMPPLPLDQKGAPVPAGLISYPADQPRGTVLFAHGLYEEQREIYRFLFTGLTRLGYSVELYCLPYHYERQPVDSLFSGEFFFSADLDRTRHAFLQAAREMADGYTRLRRSRNHPVFLAGFSMGASVALKASTALPALDGVCAINPPAGLSDLIWRSPLCRTIRADLEAAGVSRSQVRDYFRDLDPLYLNHRAVDPGRVFVIHALYDLVTEQAQYEALAEAWSFQRHATYKAGHLNTLRVPRLAEDMAGFFAALSPLRMEGHA
jgi:pimeloyl-ACP methyl ester carboxylesterase